MNILITTPHYYPTKGGTQSSLEDLTECFVADGHRTIVVTSRNPDSLPRHETHNGVEIRRLNYPPQRLLLKLVPSIVLRSFGVLFGLAGIIRRERIDVVCVGLLGIDTVFVLLLKRLLGFRLVVYVRGGEIRSTVKVSPVMRWALRGCLQRSNVVIAVSQQLPEEITAFEPLAKNKIVVLPDGINLDVINASSPYHHRRPYLLFAGRLHPDKGVDILVKAFQQVAAEAPELDLIMAGDGPLEDDLKKFVRDSGLTDRILFIGPQDRPMVFSLLKGCEFALLPSYHEGCPLAVLEAFAVGKLLIGSRVKGIDWLIRDGENGILFEVADIEGFTKKILEYHRSTNMRLKLERNIKQAGVSSYDVRNLYKKHLNAYSGSPST